MIWVVSRTASATTSQLNRSKNYAGDVRGRDGVKSLVKDNHREALIIGLAPCNMMVFVDCVLSDRGHCLGEVPIRTRGLLSGLPE